MRARKGAFDPKGVCAGEDVISERSQRALLIAAPAFLKVLARICDRCGQGFRLLVRGEVTAGQTLDPKAEHSQPLLREVDLPVFKGIFLAAADKERKLIPIRLEQRDKVEPVTLRFEH